MPNTNSQTIHQMGQAINSVVRQATGRDAVQNIDMDWVTVAQNKTVQVFSESIPYMFRRTGGGMNIGNARLSRNKVIGGTLAWNQLVYENAETVTPTAGHKVITKIDDTWNVSIASDAISITDAGDMIFDITQMFGSTIADYIYSLETAHAGDGVAWFRNLFQNAYYEYNAGELLSVYDLVSHDMTGFNQWDEDWELGYYLNGEKTASNTNIRCKNMIPVIPETNYYINFPGSYNFYFNFYDANKNYLALPGADSAGRFVINSPGEITIPQNAHYMVFALAAAYGTTYKNNICINFSNPDLNGKYEPYQLHSYPLDSELVLRGIPKLDTDNNLYYDGDVYEHDGKVTRRYGIKTFDGSESGWTAYNVSDVQWFYIEGLTGIKTQVNNISDIIGVSTKYILSGEVSQSGQLTNTIFQNDKISAFQPSYNRLWIKDTSYSTLEAFKASLATSPITVIYELETPTTDTADPFTDPQVVSPYGTEEYITTGIVPVGNETQYLELSDTNM